MNKHLDKIFEKAKRKVIDDNSKLVIMSDCHRGSGDNNDNFIKNQRIFQAALRYYYKNGFTYIELGDGDEMWEVKDYKEIVDVHIETFKLMGEFNNSGRLFVIYGNHDMVKKSQEVLEKYFYKYYDKEKEKEENLLDGLTVYESLVLNYRDYDIFLIHGHQVDFFNNKFWPVARLFVRYGWRYLEWFGINDLTSAAKNYAVSKRIEKKLQSWSIKNNKILIAGHTHRPTFPVVGQSLYFNDGSCIYQNGITCLEIENGEITLVKWKFEIVNNNLFSVKRKLLEKRVAIVDFFRKKL